MRKNVAEWCPNCHAMLPPGLKRCPSCGVKLDRPVEEGMGGKDVFWYSLYFIGIALVPILLIIGIGVICVLVGKR